LQQDEVFESIPNFRESEEDPKIEFNEAQIDDFKVCFNKFDTSGKHMVEAHEIGSLIRAAGLNPTLKEISKIIAWLSESRMIRFLFIISVKPLKKFFLEIESFTLKQFVKLLGGIWEVKDEAKELQDAFKVIDKDDMGYLSVEQLREVLAGFGEKFDDEEFKEFIKTIPVQSDGNINNSGKNSFVF